MTEKGKCCFLRKGNPCVNTKMSVGVVIDWMFIYLGVQLGQLGRNTLN